MSEASLAALGLRTREALIELGIFEDPLEYLVAQALVRDSSPFGGHPPGYFPEGPGRGGLATGAYRKRLSIETAHRLTEACPVVIDNVLVHPEPKRVQVDSVRA